MSATVKHSETLTVDADQPSVARCLDRGAHRLRASTGLGIAKLEAELLLKHVLGCSRTDLHTHPERLVASQQSNRFEALLNRRLLGEPLPYLIGHIEFFGLEMAVDERVLIPRPETETLVDLALHLIKGTPRCVVADVGTGSGCVAIALAVHAPTIELYASDVSADALAVARANAQRHHVADQISFLQSDVFSALPEPVDLIVSNPPYIALAEWSSLPREVREYEPDLALYGGPDGLHVMRCLVCEASNRLRPGGAMLLEIGAAQGPAAAHLARQAFPEADISIHSDLAGLDRVLSIKTQPNPVGASHMGDRDADP